MQNKSLELHDSKVQDIRIDQRDLILRFDRAYIHHSEGEPGRDKGTGWGQKIELRFLRASLEGRIAGLPGIISDGEFEIGGGGSDRIPVPFHSHASVRLTLVFQSGNEIQIFGEKMELHEIGEDGYIEEFPGQ